jgi:hypothetical protein
MLLTVVLCVLAGVPGESAAQILETQPVAAAASRTYYAAPESAAPPAPVGRPSADGRSHSKPFRIQDFWQVAQPGDTLLLLDGLYTGPASMINVGPDTPVSGLAGRPITIRALNDGSVRIDGQGRHAPIWIWGSYGIPKQHFVIEGVDACNSRYMVVLLSRCEDCVVRRVCAWNAKPESNAHVYTLDRTFRCMIEDCAAWGLGRKQLLIYGGNPGQSEPYGADNVIRRFWCRWEGTRNLYHSENISFQYRATRGLLENVICTYDAWESIEYPAGWTFSGFFYTDGPAEHITGTRLLGCIGYAPREANLQSPYVFTITGMDLLDVTLRDCLTCIAPGRQRGRPEHQVLGLVTNGRYYDSVRAEHLTVVGGAGIKLGARDRSLEPARSVVQNALIMRTMNPEGAYQAAVVGGRHVDTVHFFDNDENFPYVTSLANVPGNILSPPGPAGGCTDLSRVNLSCRIARGTDPQLNTAGRSLVRPYTSPALRHAAPDGSDVGARVWFRYVDGTLQKSGLGGRPEYLWPWPMEERIWRATLNYHLLDPVNHPGPVNVTTDVLTLDGGSLPGDFDGDGDIDWADSAAFERYRTGPKVPIREPEGYSFDFDEDGDVDTDDRLVFDTWFGYARPDFAQYRLLLVRTTAPETTISADPPDLHGLDAGLGRFTGQYLPGIAVRLIVPQTVAGRVFDRWKLNGLTLTKGERVLSVVLNDDQTVEAVYSAAK